jgi:hypothetical protein
MLEPTPDIRQLYHNTRVNIPQCSLEFLFARFAWSIFSSLSGFLSRPAKNRLVVRLNASGERFVEEATNSLVLLKKATTSHSNIPTKRARIAADLDEDAEYSSKRLRRHEAKSNESSFDSTLPTLEDDSDFERRPSYTMNILDLRYTLGVRKPWIYMHQRMLSYRPMPLIVLVASWIWMS